MQRGMGRDLIGEICACHVAPWGNRVCGTQDLDGVGSPRSGFIKATLPPLSHLTRWQLRGQNPLGHREEGKVKLALRGPAHVCHSE